MLDDLQMCACGSGLSMRDCCSLWLDGDATAPTAEALMRSRYAAYVTGRRDYLLNTWHPATRPESAAMGGMALRWVGLEIVATEQGGEDDTQGIVEFIASYVQSSGGRQVSGSRLHERSRFVRESLGENRCWLYVDGDCRVSDIGRNDACPCASGRKFKRCCGVLPGED